MIGAAAEKLMRDAAPAGADVDIEWNGVPPGLMRPDAPPIQLGLEAFEQVLGVRPLLVRSGGTLPIVPGARREGHPDDHHRLRRCRSRTSTRRTRSSSTGTSTRASTRPPRSTRSTGLPR